MIFTIARKEFVEIVRDERFRLMAGVVLLLLSAALAAGWKHNWEVSRERAAAQTGAREVWLNQGKKDPHSAAHYGTYAFKPRIPLAFADEGIDPFVGTAIYLEAHKQNNAVFVPARDGNALQRFGELTAAAVLQTLVPLLIFLLAFASVAGEREQGTLRQLLSSGIARRDLALGKFAGIAAALFLLLVPATIIGVAAIMLSATNSDFAQSSWRALLMIVGYLLYFGAILGVSLAVSAAVSSSKLALVILLGFWIFNSLVAPRAAAEFSKQIAPVPQSSEFWAAIENDIKNGSNGHDPRDKRAEQIQKRLLEQYGVDKVENLPINYVGVVLQAGEEHSNEVYDKHFGDLWDKYEQQQQWQQIGGIIAPHLAIRSLSMSLAGTDFSHHRRFAAAAESYRRTLVKSLNDDLARSSKFRQEYLADRNLWERIADFDFASPDMGWVLRKQFAGVAILLVWFAGAIAAALFFTARSRV